jgi:hypothetical protein
MQAFVRVQTASMRSSGVIFVHSSSSGSGVPLWITHETAPGRKGRSVGLGCSMANSTAERICCGLFSWLILPQA